MRFIRRLTTWLETHWVTPAYSGWLLLGLSVFFFIAGTNTLSGWLYVLSGIGLALLAIAAILPERTLRQLQVHRAPIHPVSAGDPLTIELILENRSNQPKSLLQIQDLLPSGLGKPVTQSIEVIPPHQAHHWIYQQPAERRGIYRWQGVELRTGAPLGLFWCRRDRPAKARAIVYPLVLPLAQCPLIDEMGRDPSLQFNSDRRAQAATEGLTRSLRPYRWGDPTRLIHWRTSARYGELRIRELEIFTGGQELVIGLDSGHPWSVNPGKQNDFEQAVVAAASLYFYACRRAIQVKVWTAGSGLVHGNQGVLETLAETMAGEEIRATGLPKQPLIWLTQNPAGLSSLPPGSRWLLWPAIRQGDTHHPSLDPAASTQTEFPFDPPRSPGRIIHIHQPLQLQLQSPLDR